MTEEWKLWQKKMMKGGKTMNNFSLYTITSAFPILMENDEISEEEKNQIKEELSTLLANKSMNIIAYWKNEELKIEAKEAEEKRLAESRKADEKRLENFKKYVKECMENNGIIKVETELGNLTVARNPLSVEITNEDEIPSEYKTEITTVKIDKTKIKENFKATGEIPAGVNILTNNTSLRIK